MAGIFGSGISLAQNAVPQTQANDISLPAQSLSSALRELARQTDSQVVFSPEAVADKSAPAISGALDARQAAERLLQGTGLVVVQDGDMLIVRAAPQTAPSSTTNEETTLPTVTVSAQAERDTLTEGSGSYTTGATSVTTKLPLTLRETPQSITVITRQQMDDFGLNTVAEVLQNTSSVYTSKVGLTDTYWSRGFFMQNQYDGIANPLDQQGGSI